MNLLVDVFKNPQLHFKSSNTVAAKCEQGCKCAFCSSAINHNSNIGNASSFQAQTLQLNNAIISMQSSVGNNSDDGNTNISTTNSIPSQYVRPVQLFDLIKRGVSHHPWPTTGESGKVAQELQQRIATELPELKGITPGVILDLAKNYRPDLVQAMPNKLFQPLTEQDLLLNINEFQSVVRFDKSIEDEFSADASNLERMGQAQIMRFKDSPGYNTGVQLEIVNESGSLLTKEQTFALLNKSTNREVREAIHGVSMHEQAHKLCVEANPDSYVKVSGWYEPIKIVITKESLKGQEPVAITTRGQADIEELIYNYVESAVIEIEELWQQNLDIVKDFPRLLTASLNQSPQTAINRCNMMVNYLHSIERTLQEGSIECSKYAYACQNMVVSALVPILLIYNFPVHAGTLSNEDVSIARDFLLELKKSQYELTAISARQQVIADLINQVNTVKAQIQQGQRPTGQLIISNQEVTKRPPEGLINPDLVNAQ